MSITKCFIFCLYLYNYFYNPDITKFGYNELISLSHGTLLQCKVLLYTIRSIGVWSDYILIRTCNFNSFTLIFNWLPLLNWHHAKLSSSFAKTKTEKHKLKQN